MNIHRGGGAYRKWAWPIMRAALRNFLNRNGDDDDDDDDGCCYEDPRSQAWLGRREI